MGEDAAARLQNVNSAITRHHHVADDAFPLAAPLGQESAVGGKHLYPPFVVIVGGVDTAVSIHAQPTSVVKKTGAAAFFAAND